MTMRIAGDTSASAEPILLADLPICDSHHHLWSRPGHDYLLDDFLGDIGGGHNIVSTVFVECGTSYDEGSDPAFGPVGETRFAEAAATAASIRADVPRICAAIVGFADLTRGPMVGDVLDAHREASGRFRGVRHCAAYDDDPAILSPTHVPISPDMLASAGFHGGMREIARRSLCFDAWVYHPQMGAVRDLARAFPGVQFILDHLGGPLGIGGYRRRRAEVFDDWKAGIASLAELPNVAVKVGGICMPLNGWGLHRREHAATSTEIAAMIRPYVLHAIDAFGVSRCLFESNFPADKPSLSYDVYWNAMKRLTIDFSHEERMQLFHDNAIGIYRMDQAAAYP